MELDTAPPVRAQLQIESHPHPSRASKAAVLCTRDRAFSPCWMGSAAGLSLVAWAIAWFFLQDYSEVVFLWFLVSALILRLKADVGHAKLSFQWFLGICLWLLLGASLLATLEYFVPIQGVAPDSTELPSFGECAYTSWTLAREGTSYLFFPRTKAHC